MLNGTLGDSQIVLLSSWCICHGKGELLMKARSPAWHAKSEPMERGSTTGLAGLFKVNFMYVWDLGGRFSRSIQEFLMLFGFHRKSDI